MKKGKAELGISTRIHRFIRDSFNPHFGQLNSFKSNPVWQQLSKLGSRLWFDTGNIDEAQQRWTREFSALTTNNTLLNKEIQTGRYDSLISETADFLASYPHMTSKQIILEIAFVLNAWHALRLVEKFDAYVSVEEHTDLANDVTLAVDYARRFYEICPERFIIKLPFTPAGLLATRKLSGQGIPVNHTLGFSSRQNYLIARMAKPAYVNVFLGRLNSFIVDNKLGSGLYIGEKATLASQKAIRQLRQSGVSQTLQIGASFRTGAQIRDLAGIDVMTMPPKAADEFLALNLPIDEIKDKTAENYRISLNNDVKPEAINLNTLWDINDELVSCVDALEKEDIDKFTPNDLLEFFEKHKCGDVLVRWSDSQIATSAKEGKIPKLENWKDALEDKSIGLDSLMNLAGLNSFATDQQAMDERVRQVLAKT
ncbi:MAG: transaldolase family protein [Sedimentisphaerales bacterium]|jgi:transaldolase